MMMLSKAVLFFVSTLTLSTASSECQPSLTVGKSDFKYGQPISVQLEGCETSEHDFVAIYPDNTPLKEIKGDANYEMWLWTCGSQLCEGGELSTTLAFGPENNRHTWPLPSGNYKAHLVKRFEKQERHWYSSVATTVSFHVEQPPVAVVGMRTLEEECVDGIEAAAPEFVQGEEFAIQLQNECGLLTEDDWFGFFPASACDDNALCHGDPILWSWGCRGDGCHKFHRTYRFPAQAENDSTPLLEGGSYRVVLVDQETVTEDGESHQGRLISKVFEVVQSGEPSLATWRLEK